MEVINPQQQQPYSSQPTRTECPVSVGDWFITMLIMVIPLVNLIMLFVWAFGGSTTPSKANWAKASLIWMLVGIVFAILFGSAIIAMIVRMAY